MTTQREGAPKRVSPDGPMIALVTGASFQLARIEGGACPIRPIDRPRFVPRFPYAIHSVTFPWPRCRCSSKA